MAGRFQKIKSVSTGAAEPLTRRAIWPLQAYTSPMGVTLKDIEAMVDALGSEDRHRLLQYLLPRLTDTGTAGEPVSADLDRAWHEFRRVGERLAATSNGVSITRAITDMRR
jgi:hypothetical protein